MTNRTFLDYAKAKGLKPFAWFEVNYPAYTVKVKYKYPTSDPADFRDRALLQMIDLGVPYTTACSLLMVADPYQSLLQRFQSGIKGLQLVHFDKVLDRLALTPIGKQRIEQIELASHGTSCCFIDGSTGDPFPVDVVDNLKDRFVCKEVYNIPGGIYPFDADIEHKIAELNAKINNGNGRNYQKRLGIREKAREISMIPLGPKWMTNLSIGIFLKGTEVVRRIFCDDRDNPISPFGWLENINNFKLDGSVKSNRFSYLIDKSNDTSLFVNDSTDLNQLILDTIGKEYGTDFIRQISLARHPKTSQIQIFINNIDETARNRSGMLSIIENGFMSIQLPGMTGSLFIEVKASECINSLGHLRNKIDRSVQDWHEIIDMVKKDYPNNWRQTLIAIDRHDLVFRHDIEQFINYGK